MSTKDTLSKVNFFLEQYRERDLLAKVENSSAKEEMMNKKVQNLSDEQLGKCDQIDSGPGWLDGWVNIWANRPVEKNDEECEQSGTRLTR